MREPIGGAWLIQIVVFFVLLFTAYLALSLNFSKAFSVKNEIVDIIERNKGLSDDLNGSIDEIYEYINTAGYRTTGSCNKGSDTQGVWYGLNNEGKFEVANGDEPFYVCVKQMKAPGSDSPEVPNAAYYRVKVFFHLDLPIFGDIFDLQIAGDTTKLYYPSFDV